MRAVPLLVAALLVLSTPAMSMVAADPPKSPTDPAESPIEPPESPTEPPAATLQESQSTAENATPNRLSVDDPAQRAYVEPTADLATTISSRGVAIRNDYETFAIRNGFDDLDGPEQRDEIDAALERIEQRIDSLQERERRAVSRHAGGDVGDDRLVRTLVEAHRESVELDRALQDLESQAGSVPGYSIQGDKRTLEGLLEVHRSPVRDRIDSILRGEDRPTRPSGVVYLETAEEGLLLSTIDDRDYVREAVRYDNRDPDSESRYDGIGEVLTTWNEFYPWILDRDGFAPAPNYYSFPAAQLYSVGVSHPQGDLTAHLDGGTGEVYREVQRLEIDQLPSERAGTWTENGIELSINHTPYDGPIRIAAADAETNASIAAAVEIDGVPLGAVDGDSLWVIPPSGEYEVSVRDGHRSANATVDPGGR